MAMKIGTAAFKERVSEGIDNEFMRGAVSGAQERLRTRRLQAAEELGNWEDWRSHAEEIRQHVLDNLDFYLEQLAENVANRGGHVFFAETAEEASSYIRDVIRQKNAKKIVKSKSMVTEEINMNEVLEEEGCEVTERTSANTFSRLTIMIRRHISLLPLFTKTKSRSVTCLKRDSNTNRRKNRKSSSCTRAASSGKNFSKRMSASRAATLQSRIPDRSVS